MTREHLAANEGNKSSATPSDEIPLSVPQPQTTSSGLGGAGQGRTEWSGYAAHGLVLMAMGDRCWRNLGSDGVGLCARIRVHVVQVFTVFVLPEALAG